LEVRHTIKPTVRYASGYECWRAGSLPRQKPLKNHVSAALCTSQPSAAGTNLQIRGTVEVLARSTSITEPKGERKRPWRHGFLEMKPFLSLGKTATME
jgi:hypothetical protein